MSGPLPGAYQNCLCGVMFWSNPVMGVHEALSESGWKG